MGQGVSKEYSSFNTKKDNVIWSAAISLPWHQLASSKGVKHIQMQTQNPKLLKIINSLNFCGFVESDLNKQSIYFKSGNGPVTITNINKEVKKRFPNYPFPDLTANISQVDIVLFSYLFKELSFRFKFTRRKFPIFKFNNREVYSMYAEQGDQKKQVRVCHYKSKECFCVCIPDNKTSDLLFLLKDTSKELSIGEVMETVQSFESKNQQILKQSDAFEMPIIDIDTNRSYKELGSLPFVHASLKKNQLKEMVEGLKIKVDDSVVKEESPKEVLDLMKNMFAVCTPDREFILDKSFWLVMQQRSKPPYLCMKIIDPIDH